MIRILLVDDHDIVMDGIASLLSDVPQLKVVGKASSVDIAKEMIPDLLPDLVLTDITMGAASGLDLTRFIASSFPLVRVIVLTMHGEVHHISSMLEAGACGYLLKNVGPDELIKAIHQVMAGQRYLQQTLAGPYSRSLRSQQASMRQCTLSPREVEIIRLVAGGMTSAEISQKLFLSEHTVDTHRKNILRKTGAKGVIGLVNYARERGLLD